MKIPDRLPDSLIDKVRPYRNGKEEERRERRWCLDKQRWWSIVLGVRFDQKYLTATLGIWRSFVIEPDERSMSTNQLKKKRKKKEDVEISPI